MNSQQIEYVLTLAEEKSFSKASQKLFVTQPSLSQFIKNLESQLNIQLFDRSTSPIRLTSAGEAYVKAARKIKAIEDELKIQITDLNNLQTGDLTIGTSPFRASCLLPKSIAAFHKMYPGVNINIVENRLPNLEEAVLDGILDLYLGTGPLDEDLFYTEVLAKEQLYLAVPPDSKINGTFAQNQISEQDIKLDTYHLNKTPSIDLVHLKDELFIFPHQSHKLYGQVMDICNDSSLEPNIILYSERLETSFAWTLAGLGFTFIPDFLIRFGNYDKHPIYYKLNHPLATRSLMIAYKKNRYLSRAAIEYISTLKKLIGFGTWNYPSF